MIRLLNPGIQAVGVVVDLPLETAAGCWNGAWWTFSSSTATRDEDYIRALKERTDRPVWKAFQIARAADLEAAQNSCADMIVLDNGQGTGECFDWSLLSGFERPFTFWPVG